MNLLDTRQAAERLRLSVATLAKYRVQGAARSSLSWARRSFMIPPTSTRGLQLLVGAARHQISQLRGPPDNADKKAPDRRGHDDRAKTTEHTSKIAPHGATPPLLGRAALKYARQGWPVLPCEPRGKRPVTARGFHDASSDLEQVSEWWRQTPDGNIGVVPGRVALPGGTTLLVIDVDGPEGRESALALDVPEDTATVATGRDGGGEHRYFRVPAGVTIGNRSLASGLDVRHAAGYVLVPPSVHPTGARYRWRSCTLLPIPPQLLERLTAPPAPITPAREPRHDAMSADAFAWLRVERYLAHIPSGLGDGDGRNNTAFRLAAFVLHDAGLPESSAWDVLVAWNRDNACPLGERELSSALRNALRHGGRRAA